MSTKNKQHAKKKNTKMFCSKNSLAKMLMFGYDGINQPDLTRYSLLVNDRKGMAKAVTGLKLMLEKPTYRHRFKTVIIYENTDDDSGIELAKAIDGVWQ